MDADPKQVRTALTCLLRNAIEAAPAGRLGPSGWRRRRRTGWSWSSRTAGPARPQAQREHLFDPFYSGRPAGRGRGLGLPTAWRLAREQGGEVLLASRPGEPTRFVLWLPAPPGITLGQTG